MRLLRIALVGLTLLIGPVPASAQLTDLLPEGAYGTALGTALQTGAFDFAALRASYAADPAYTGRSRLRDHDPASSPKWTEDDVLRAIFADFPLLDTHMAAFDHYRTAPLPNAGDLTDAHAMFYRDILEVILATRREGPDGPVFTVLSIAEEYAVLSRLERKSTGQALMTLDGRPHDRHDTAEGPVFFDISAFFGK